MWFSMPKGCGGITVEHMEFVPEVTDAEGTAYFRAPDHFSTRILGINGFKVAQPPEGAPEDLPRADPLRDGAIAELTHTLAARDTEVQNLRSDLLAANAKITALMHENEQLLIKLNEANGKVLDFEEQIEDGTLVQPQTNVELLKKAK